MNKKKIVIFIFVSVIFVILVFLFIPEYFDRYNGNIDNYGCDLAVDSLKYNEKTGKNECIKGSDL